MYQSTYYIDKLSNTFADNLAAFGLAFVLNGIAAGRAKLVIEDQGRAFAVNVAPAIDPAWVEECQFFTGAPFLITIDNASQQRVIKGTNLSLTDVPEAPSDVVADYGVEKQNYADFFVWLSGVPAPEKAKVVRGESPAPARPHSDWDLFRAVNPAALQTYNALLAEWWRGQDAFPELLRVLLAMAATQPNDLDGAASVWANLCKAHGWTKPKEVGASQLLNPAQGKGTNSTKAEWSAPGNVKGFWLLEWLKLVGLRYGGLTRLVRGTKDRKTYALAPVRLEWGAHVAIMNRFRIAMAGSAQAIQLDILATLCYTQALLAHLENARTSDLAADVFGHNASDLVSGMQMAFYKSLGNAIATMNIASLNLPRWVAPRGPEDLALLSQALDEHAAIVRGLDENHGDQYGILNAYRDFLSGSDLTPFFAFSNAYSRFVISQMERRKPVRLFTTTTLEVLFMNSNDGQQSYSQIVQDPGFRQIAYAIRHSTVVPQARKGKPNRSPVDIRYGLGQQLARKAASKGEFLAELAEFVHLYNAENAQLRENKREPLRKNVTIDDLDSITRLVDRFGSKVVCHMLVAYGYAREPYQGRDEEGAGEAPELAAVTSDGDSGGDEAEAE